MRKNNILYVFIKYMREKLKIILLFLLFSLVFLSTFKLYKISVEPVAYSASICLFVLIVYILINFPIYYKKHQSLCSLENNIALAIEDLPKTKNIIENDYTDLLNKLNEDFQNYRFEADKRENDLIDYYTMWVHQIKTPIAATKLLLQTTESEIKSDLSSELFKIEQYVEMALSYIRLGSNQNDFVIKKYSLDNIVRQAIRKYAPLFIRKKLSVNFEETGLYVLTDEKWAVFVIEQILSNAIKYTKKGGISIYLEDNKLVIEDSGIGISKEDIPRIFDKGFTGCNGRLDKKATGLGLYLCKEITNKLSHKISIESEVGVKTKVYLDFSMLDINVE